jgi:hypothetical protein
MVIFTTIFAIINILGIFYDYVITVFSFFFYSPSTINMSFYCTVRGGATLGPQGSPKKKLKN